MIDFGRVQDGDAPVVMIIVRAGSLFLTLTVANLWAGACPASAQDFGNDPLFGTAASSAPLPRVAAGDALSTARSSAADLYVDPDPAPRVLIAAGVVVLAVAVGSVIALLVDRMFHGPGSDYSAWAVAVPNVALSGLAGIFGGAIWLRYTASRPERAPSAFAFTPLPNGAALSWSGSF